MKKIKDVSDEDDYEVDDPDDPEVEGASEEEWAPEPGAEVRSTPRAKHASFLDPLSNFHYDDIPTTIINELRFYRVR